MLFMTLNSFPPKHCLLYSIEKVGLGTGEAVVETGATAFNRGKWSEGEGESEREERGKVSYELMLLLMTKMMVMMRQRVWFLSS